MTIKINRHPPLGARGSGAGKQRGKVAQASLPAGSGSIPAPRFVPREHGAGMLPEPASWEACATAASLPDQRDVDQPLVRIGGLPANGLARHRHRGGSGFKARPAFDRRRDLPSGRCR